MKLEKEKSLIAFLCGLGIVAVAYGMFKKNDLIFITGLFLIIGGYLLIRRKLKGHIQNKH